jgi:hypothetical protein
LTEKDKKRRRGVIPMDEEDEKASESADSQKEGDNIDDDDTNKFTYPEKVEFSGIGYTSLLQVHISAALIILVGVIVAIVDSPQGLFLLLAFLVIVFLIEIWMIRRSRKELRLTLYLRENPVEAYQGTFKVGSIDHGSIDPEMDSPSELGYRPSPKKDLIIWTFDSEQDKQIAAKRLLEYLPLDDATDYPPG